MILSLVEWVSVSAWRSAALVLAIVGASLGVGYAVARAVGA